MWIRNVPILALVALVACGFGSTVRQQVHQTVPDAATATVHLTNDVGSVTVTAWNKPSIDIQAVKSADSLQALHAIGIAVRRDSGGVYVETTYSGAVHQGGVSYTLSVPAGASLDVRNTTGSITADLGTVAGGRSVSLTATTGSIRLSMARDSSAKVDARSSVGSIHSGFPGVVPSRQNVVGASALGAIGSGSARVHLATTTGSISLTPP